MIKKQLESLMEINKIDNLSELSRRTGLAKSVLHGYLNNAEPTLKNLIKLIEYFGVSLDYFVGRDNTEVLYKHQIEGKFGKEYIISVKALITKGE